MPGSMKEYERRAVRIMELIPRFVYVITSECIFYKNPDIRLCMTHLAVRVNIDIIIMLSMCIHNNPFIFGQLCMIKSYPGSKTRHPNTRR